ncbi:MAG: hypothetical protein A2563_02260 [Candidatus Magasanikbacteria bacterium RIFOXYD1_FULL_40_23]|uniref:Uncharacterized protein n=1 Tax=Candidatus Magasanikbacteria bacterium RIFOXYD1_FULL_40_23 TaxID=1798705 RepID=A0A1F6PB72_9BACT|nr:MAG: hypothetical protein A2563_02260 [Candidatus Magasanikbacteria bacterium RIFOXYD1_FULL_40_23]
MATSAICIATIIVALNHHTVVPTLIAKMGAFAQYLKEHLKGTALSPSAFPMLTVAADTPARSRRINA